MVSGKRSQLIENRTLFERLLGSIWCGNIVGHLHVPVNAGGQVIHPNAAEIDGLTGYRMIVE